jgi:hypothetical protein
MSDWGFLVERLSLTGPAVETAEVELKSGLNVVVGASDTGKTFMVQCIDYALGAGDTPEEIPEAEKYDLVSVALRSTFDDQMHVLQRSLRGGDIRLTTNGVSRDLLSKHQAGREDTISHFLLGLSGLLKKKVCIDNAGATRELSFRDIARLTVIDEEAVMAKRSAALPSQRTGKTRAISAFRLVLTGVDDSTVVAGESAKVVKNRRDGKKELLDDLIRRTQEALTQLQVGSGRDEVTDALAKIEDFFSRASLDLRSEQASVAALEEQRHAAWTALRQADSRLDVVRQLRKRFDLLSQQYVSDLRRLETIAEAGGRLAQMTEERCPVCGSAVEHHDKTHQREKNSPQDVAVASRAEADKIQALLNDLQKTLEENVSEDTRLLSLRQESQRTIDAITQELRATFEPRMQAVLARLQASQEQRDKLRSAADLFERMDELMELRAAAEATKAAAPTGTPASDVSAAGGEAFSQEIETLLREWNFPNLKRVTYSDADHDVVISGRRRRSHGKGVRAVTHAAFTLALLRYCEKRTMPHPRMVVIDSPLVVYREPDPDEKGFSPEVKDAFYRSLTKSFGNQQVVIFENDDPPADVMAAATIIKFTGTESGRYGFIPLPQSATPVA